MKDRSILSALYDGEIHPPFRDRCQEVVAASQQLETEYKEIERISTLLAHGKEPDFEAGKAKALHTLLTKIEEREPVRSKPRGLWLSWPMAAAAALILTTGALTAGWGLKSSGMELSFNSNSALKTQDYLAQDPQSLEVPEIRVSVPRKFTLPDNSQGQLLLSSFEGGQ
ncbi:MAG: hypothetical protein A2Z96_07310 [Spirochaetes bacterium GWB1_48_6]|nr:MAG: hypothetical protein A2Z96_07310 [Spirochaetes bacterium GWB1_48_6]